MKTHLTVLAGMLFQLNRLVATMWTYRDPNQPEHLRRLKFWEETLKMMKQFKTCWGSMDEKKRKWVLSSLGQLINHAMDDAQYFRNTQQKEGVL